MQEDGTETATDVNEAADLVGLLNSGTRPSAGLRVNGEKYMILRQAQDPATVYGKKTVGKGGICLTKTNQCIIVGVYDEDQGHTAGNCNMAVEKLGDYLRANNF